VTAAAAVTKVMARRAETGRLNRSIYPA
jgi:hypothetical protein